MADENDTYRQWCEDIGEQHAWGGWMPHALDAMAECRFCSLCGGMETQTICTDPDCKNDHEEGSP